MNAIIVGASYAGLSAALELRQRLPKRDTVIVISANDEFIFYPSLIWVVQGDREPADIVFPLGPVLEEAGIEFVQARLDSIDPRGNYVMLNTGQFFHFEKLLLATGGAWDWEAVPGLGPPPIGHTVSIVSPAEAVAARRQWQILLANPGPIVIGASLNTALYGAAYEFAFNIDIALRKAGVRDQASITFITPEPYLGHFGHNGLGNSRYIIERAFAQRQIMAVTEAQIDHIEPDAVVLGTQQRLESSFTMIVPPYRGIPPIMAVPDLADAEGRIPVDDFYRSRAYADIFAAGVAMQIKPPISTTLPCGVFIPGTVSARMGRGAAVNMAADAGHGRAVPQPAHGLKSFYVLDSGAQGLFMSLGAQPWLNLQLNIPGPWSHWAKVAAERFQMWQLQTGRY